MSLLGARTAHSGRVHCGDGAGHGFSTSPSEIFPGSCGWDEPSHRVRCTVWREGETERHRSPRAARRPGVDRGDSGTSRAMTGQLKREGGLMGVAARRRRYPPVQVSAGGARSAEHPGGPMAKGWGRRPPQAKAVSASRAPRLPLPTRNPGCSTGTVPRWTRATKPAAHASGPHDGCPRRAALRAVPCSRIRRTTSAPQATSSCNAFGGRSVARSTLTATRHVVTATACPHCAKSLMRHQRAGLPGWSSPASPHSPGSCRGRRGGGARPVRFRTCDAGTSRPSP